MRSPYQVLVFPFYKQDKNLLFALFKRTEEKVWQGIAGGGEEGETPFEAARREAKEEMGDISKSKMIQLSSVASIPVVDISGFIWGDDVLVVPEFSFGIKITSKILKICHEHSAYKWFTYKEAIEKLGWDSNRTALWELNYRICNEKLGSIYKLYDYKAKKFIFKR